MTNKEHEYDDGKIGKKITNGYNIYRNYRPEDKFDPDFHCIACENPKFNTYLVKIPYYNLLICGKCLDNMSKALDQAQVDDFQSDFKNTRREHVWRN